MGKLVAQLVTVAAAVATKVIFHSFVYVLLQAFEELEELLARHNICIAIKEKLVKDSGVAEDIAYDNIVQKLLTKPRARGECNININNEMHQKKKKIYKITM